MKRFLVSVSTLVLVCSAANIAAGASSRGDGFAMIVAPARYSVLQVAFDVIQRSPAVLISYEGDATTIEPRLHAWNGSEWVFVSPKDYREASFLQRVPSRAILIGDEKTLPASLVDASSWCPKIYTVKSLDTATLINECGRILDWRSSDWKWFTARYNLQLEDESEPLRHSSWYDRPGPLKRPPLREVVRENEQELESQSQEAATAPSDTVEVSPGAAGANAPAEAPPAEPNPVAPDVDAQPAN